MICKECGAYNPDHATYCKVCAANLKGTPAVEVPEVHEEEQPTKRFSRPSWVIPEQSEKVEQEVKETVEQVEDATEETIEEVNDNVETVVEDAIPEAPVEEETEEPVAPAWTPQQARRSISIDRENEESEEQTQEPSEEYSDENEGIYNEEEALGEDDDSFEYEPTPPKRRQQKKKNNTLFTVLLIAIIVVIVGILVVAGIFIIPKLLKKGNDTDSKANPASSSTETDDGKTQPEDGEKSEPSTTAGPSDPEPTEEPQKLDPENATLQKYVDNGSDMVAITVVVPAGSSVSIVFPHQPDYNFENTEANELTRKVKIPVEVFYPNTPLDDATYEVNPEIAITNADGSSYKVNCPSFTLEFPKLSISVESPVLDDSGMAMAPESNEISVSGKISDQSAEVSVNGDVIQVYEGGMFVYDFKFKEDAGEDDVETLRIVAKKNNYVTDEKTVQLHAYKFIPDPMVLEVRTESTGLRTGKDGTLTVKGKTLAGATLTASSDNVTGVVCGPVTVDEEGNFSFQITTDENFFGIANVRIDAAKEGAEDGNISFKITKGFANLDAFKKYYINTHKKYKEVRKDFKIADLLNNESVYAGSEYGIRITASVVEVVTNDGDTIVKMTINKTNETVYVHNFSEKWTPGENIGGKYNIYCNFLGTYEDTGCCEFIGWFAKIVK